MTRAAPSSNDIPSGILMTLAAGTARRSTRPPQPGTAMTRSPLKMPFTPSPTASTTPETSAPGAKGRTGLNWYLSSMIRVSGKLMPTALTSMTTSPAFGRGVQDLLDDQGVGPRRRLWKELRAWTFPCFEGPDPSRRVRFAT
jgi:hypothetical protein